MKPLGLLTGWVAMSKVLWTSVSRRSTPCAYCVSLERLVMIEGANKQPRLVLLCGLPGAG